MSAAREGFNVRDDFVSRAFAGYLDGARESDAARLKFFEGLYDVQSAISAANEHPYSPLGQKAATEAVIARRPLFSLNAPEIDRAALLDALSRIANYVAEMAALPAEQIAALQQLDFASVITDERVALAASSPADFIAETAVDAAAAAEGLSENTAAFVLASALTPFLEAPAAAALAEVDKGVFVSASPTCCPVCGAPATLSRIGEGSALKGAHRTLWCGLCHAEWEFERVRCSRCGTYDPELVHYLHIEEDSAHRIHVCDSCHGYIRTVFENDTPKAIALVVEDVVCAGLDAIAQQQGYSVTGEAPEAGSAEQDASGTE